MEPEANTKRRSIPVVGLGLGFGAVVTLISWLIVSSSSYEVADGAVAQFFAIAQLPAYIPAMLFSGNVHGGKNAEGLYWVFVFVEWCIVSLILAKLYKLARSNRSKPGM